jgi:hypothetical protein
MSGAPDRWPDLCAALGATDAPEDHSQLEWLQTTLNAYAASLADDGPRVAKLVETSSALCAAIGGKLGELDAFLGELDDLPESWKFSDALGALVKERFDIVATMRAVADLLENAGTQICGELGDDKGGRGGSAAARIAGGPQRRFVRALAPIFEYFRGAPSGTEDGEFHPFCFARA